MNSIYNSKKFSIGSVVYFTEMNNYRQTIRYGIVEENYSNGILIKLLYHKNFRSLKGIYDKEYVSVDDFQTPTKWYKLPQGWTYSTKLIDWRFNIPEEAINGLDGNISNPEMILKAYNQGFFVDADHNCFNSFEAEIGKDGWRIIRKPLSYGEHYPLYVTIYPNEVYETYEEAKKVCDDYKAELDRQAALSDYEWSVEQIDKNINKLIAYNLISYEKGEAYRKFLLSQNYIEDIETRLSMGDLQWKYCKNKKWSNIKVDA